MLFQPIARQIDERTPLPRGVTLLAAVSGGIDSVVLLHVLSRLAKAREWQVVVGHINHNLRGAESDADAAYVAAYSAGLGLKCLTHTLDGSLLHAAGNVQAAAREARYEALRDMAASIGASAILTAHHADDQAETLLLALLHGAGLDGLGGMSARQGDIIRPLLRTTRAEIEAYAKQHELVWRDDATNAHDHYARNRLRHGFLATLEAEQPRARRLLAETAERLGEAAAALRFCAEEKLQAYRLPPTAAQIPARYAEQFVFAMDTTQLTGLPPGLRLAVWRAALRAVRAGDLYGFLDVHWRQIDRASYVGTKGKVLLLPHSLAFYAKGPLAAFIRIEASSIAR